MEKLPIKLAKEPLVDVIFELRFVSSLQASNILPGILFGALGASSIEDLPLKNLPFQIRSTNPEMRYMPILRLKWKEYWINVGDRSIGITCQMPYLGWSNYKPAILEVLDKIKDLLFIESIERYSMKYVDLIQAKDLEQQIKALNFSLKIGKHSLKKEVFQSRIEILEDGYTKMLQVISAATATLPDKSQCQGVVIDVDIAKDVNNELLSKFLENISDKLDQIHAVNKSTFFDLITDDTIKSLEPVYE